MAILLKDLTNGVTVRATGTQPEWVGTAVFDVLMKAVNENINIQFEQNRITGSDYATVYLGAIETCIKEAINFLLQKAIADKDTDLKQAQILKLQAETLNIQEETKLKQEEIKLKQEEIKLKKEANNLAIAEAALKQAQADAYPDQAAKDLLVKQANIDLLDRQKEGFDDNKHQKLFEAQMNAWALMFSSGLLETKPAIINDDSASSLYNTLKP